MLSSLKSIFKSSYKSKLASLANVEAVRVPVIDTGIPLHSPETLIANQQDVISNIKLISECDSEKFDKYHATLIYNYAKYVHQLPASENHHHSTLGGLFRHGLEVAAYAYRTADDRIFDPNARLEKRRVVEPVYKYCVFIAALLHDLGKATYDVVVHDSTHGEVWDPFTEPLYDWAIRNELTHYYVHYSKNRIHKKHELLTSIVIGQVIPKHCLSYIHSADPQILPVMLGALSGVDSAEDNEVLKIVESSDHNSVRLNLQGALDLEGHNFAGVTLPQHFINTSKLLGKTKFKPNKPGSKVYYSKGDTFLIFPAALQMVIDQLDSDGVKGIPKDPEVFLDQLVSSNVVRTRKDSFGSETPIWNLKFTKRDNSTAVKFKCIRLTAGDSIQTEIPARHAQIEILNDQGEVIENYVDQDSNVNSNESSSDNEKSNDNKTSDRSKLDPKPAKQKKSTLPSILSGLDKASAASIFLNSLISDLKKPVEDIIKTCVYSDGHLCLLYPQIFDHYGIDASTTSAELLSKTLIDSRTCDPEKVTSDITVNDKKFTVIKFTQTFSNEIVPSTSKPQLKGAGLKPQQELSKKENSQDSKEGQGAPISADLVQSFIDYMIAQKTMEITFSKRMFKNKLYLDLKKSIKWYVDHHTEINRADLEKVLATAQLREEIPRELTEFSPQTTMILPVDWSGGSNGVSSN